MTRTAQPRDHDPRRPDNRAGLDRIAYRIATQTQSLDRMLWQMPRQRVQDPQTGAQLEPLEALTTRDLSDPTISLLDAWSTAVDVLSFYSERVAQEGYIGTATQRRSVLELARMIGYELAPGVAASVHLAFQVEDADDPYRTVPVPAGVQALSIPQGKDELPQTFETVEEITARAEWNDIHARTQRSQRLALFHQPGDARDGTLYLFDTDGSFDAAALADPDLQTFAAPGDLAGYHPLRAGLDLEGALLDRIEDASPDNGIVPAIHALPVDEVCLDGLGLALEPGARMIAVGQAPGGPVTAMPLRVVRAEEDAAFGLTRVVLTRSGRAPDKVRQAPVLIASIMLPGLMPAGKLSFSAQALGQQVVGKRWTGDGLTALVRAQHWKRAEVMSLVARITDVREDAGTELGFFVMRDSAGFFGSTAPLWDTLSFGDDGKGGKDKGPYTSNWDNPLGSNTIWNAANGSRLTGEAQVFLEREIKAVQPGGWAVIETEKGEAVPLRVAHAATQSRADYAISGKATGIGFETAEGGPLDVGAPTDANIYNGFRFRSSQFHGVSQRLPMAGIPMAQDVEAGAHAIELDGLYLDFERGRPVALSGARRDAEGLTGRETQVIAEVQHIDGITRLLFEGATAHSYDRTTLRLNGNVALATHGETVEEPLGSGDARLVHQTFALSRPPLTYVSAATETGRASTLAVRVGGVLWQELPSLGTAGPEDAVYEVRLADDGTCTVRFGDGARGRRLPSGELNVSATYRTGLGPEGQVPAEAIAQLKTRPLGVRGVVNPSPATGAAPPETLEAARLNAPAAVRTLGRIVSLADYQSFALAYAGVGKAQVSELWSGQDKVVHLTIAPESGGALSDSDPLIANLRASVDAVRDPARTVIVAPHVPRLFTLTATLDVDPAYRPADVELAVRTGLTEAFGYDARALGQAVTAAEVIAALHRVAGVVAADLDALAVLLGGDVIPPVGAAPETVLPAYPARGPGQRGQGSGFAAAELLTVLPSAIILSLREAT